MSFLTDALDELVATLVSVGETVADSAAAIRPPVAVVDPPTVSTVSGSIFRVDWLVTLTEQPPGSDRAVRRLLDRVAAIGAVLPISSASPTVYSVAGTDLPGMSLTIQLTYQAVTPPPPFSPLDLSPVLWLDASDTSTITESGGSVSQWDDKSGNGNDVTQGTAADQPITGLRTINSLNTLYFQGGGDNLSISGLTASQPIITFVVAQKDTGSGRFYANGITSTIISTGASILYAGVSVTGSPGDASDGTPYIFRCVYAGAFSTFHVDGTQTVSGNAGSFGPFSPFNIGGSGPNWWNGLIAEVIIVDGTLTAGEIADTETYLANKWGITLP